MSSQALEDALQLSPHPEGGFFRRTHENPLTVPVPFPTSDPSDKTRLASTSIHYLLTKDSPIGHFHRNKALTYHFHHRGRGRYRLIHEDGRVEEYIVGGDIAAGEKLMWVVEGGIWKSSAVEGADELLISEVVVPGFEFKDHEFMSFEILKELLGEEKAREWSQFLKSENRQGSK
ncbi:RmlC-like cupin domain-containing protein [Pyronema omphalodes]|nr:RmlC-like cupin domain-containing protein [Pyronema omphalodes]